MEIARNGAISEAVKQESLEHCQHCATCAAELERQRVLTAGLRALRDASTALSASPALEQKLRAVFEQRQQNNRPVRWAAVAAGVAVIIAISWGVLKPRPVEQEFGSADRVVQEFIRVPYREVIPLEGGYVVRVEMPRSALVTFGVPTYGQGTEMVQADLVLGFDGVAHAVRVVR
jgi:hypothetical protein